MERRSITRIKKIIKDSIYVKEKLLGDPLIIDNIFEVTEIIKNTFLKNGKVLLCGNGGSAADAQHIAAELSGKFYIDRKPLFAEALHVNTSYLTAVSNDYSYNEVFSRLVMAMGKKGDVLIALSTSGNSMNVLRALEEAKKIGLITVGLTGKSGRKMKHLCDYLINVPSEDTPRIQEAHILIGHIICELVERELFYD